MNASDLFFSLISDIKSYSGKDPLLPWLRGVKKMKETLPSNVLKEKLPRFLQKCSLTFLSDRRYRNDLRYLRVWLQLMDYVDEPRSLLRTMEMNQIGLQSLFYQAYALYYEKLKKFEEAEKMYHLGAQNLAEPIDDLQKAYEQFLHRMEKHKNRNIQRCTGRTSNESLSTRQTEDNNDKAYNCHDRPSSIGVYSSKLGLSGESSMIKECAGKAGHRDMSKGKGALERELCESKKFHGDDNVVVKFVDTAIVGKSEAEDACHHGLVDPTINMKGAMNAINSVFREPLETAPVNRRSHRSQSRGELDNKFIVFVEEILDNQSESSRSKEKASTSSVLHVDAQSSLLPQEPFQIFSDEEENHSEEDESNENSNLEQAQSQAECPQLNTFGFLCPKDHSSEGSEEMDEEKNSHQAMRREDTVVHKFVGATILDEPVVENACHHGLVDPTINLKEAMDDINNMFGKPIDFVRSKRPKKQNSDPPVKQNLVGFSILPDDDLGHQQGPPVPKLSRTRRDADLFEPTVFTKEAMDDINKMFGMPLDF